MPTHSTILDHPDRARIEFDLAKGVPIRVIAKKYANLNIHKLYRFRAALPVQLKTKHLGAKLKAGADLEKLRLDESEGLLVGLAQQRARLLMCQDAALLREDGREATFIAGEIHRNLKLVGQYLGEFAQHQIKTTVSVLIQPEYLEMRASLMRALSPFPEARRAVAAALQAAEAKAAATPPARAELPAPPMIDGVANEVAADV
jgi:hypothetical protein